MSFCDVLEESLKSGPAPRAWSMSPPQPWGAELPSKSLELNFNTTEVSVLWARTAKCPFDYFIGLP